ncbi:hypothetical protein [Nonomuraea zeae]|uniref:Uncharacterized protein n=1 Tax=Nonomuraea zeae TaxID=1642303 RepID=A0A5S4GD21_9ACTN|nr:hypothetical protein [Nonomuraea zeae]TMR30662.1 hypothetical protein ETD85_28255 [Nonomuraea zeae]
MTLAPPESAFRRLPASSGRRLGSGWVPAGLVCAGAVAVLLWCGVPARDLGVFAAYLTLGVALPGTLLWRAPVFYTHLRAHETLRHLGCRLLLEKKTHAMYFLK